MAEIWVTGDVERQDETKAGSGAGGGPGQALVFGELSSNSSPSASCRTVAGHGSARRL